MLDHEIEYFVAEISARSCREVQVVDKALVFLLHVILVNVNDCLQETIQTLSRVKVTRLQLAVERN